MWLRCGHASREVDDKMNKYKYEGLADNIWLTNGVESTPTPFGNAIKIAHLDRLGLAVLHAILQQPSRLTGGSVAFLRTRLDITQRDLAEMLDISVQTVSLWERNAHLISAACDIVLRSLVYQGLSKKEKGEIRDFNVAMVAKFCKSTDPIEINLSVDREGNWTHCYQRKVKIFILGSELYFDSRTIDAEVTNIPTTWQASASTCPLADDLWDTLVESELLDFSSNLAGDKAWELTSAVENPIRPIAKPDIRLH